MKHGLVTLVVIMILKDTATFQVQYIISLFCAWNITFTYLKVKSADCLCLFPVVLVLLLVWVGTVSMVSRLVDCYNRVRVKVSVCIRRVKMVKSRPPHSKSMALIHLEVSFRFAVLTYEVKIC